MEVSPWCGVVVVSLGGIECAYYLFRFKCKEVNGRERA